MRTPADIIEAKGGPAAFAAAIGAEPTAVRMMKHRNKLPRKVWPEILTAYPDITMATLQAAEKAASRLRYRSSSVTPNSMTGVRP
jgi:hypothetical protein